MIRYFSSYYRELNPKRRQEIADCLDHNANDHTLDAAFLFLDRVETPTLVGKNWTFQVARTRPTYNEFLNWAADTSPSPEDVTIIANSDIYFDESLVALAEALKPGQVAALSRWDVQPDGSALLFDRNDSQDAWVFKGPLRDIQADFPVGIPRCDNRFLHELKRAGYEVINPAFSVRAYHLHSGERKEYQNGNLEHFVEPPYAYLWPHNLWSLPRTLWHNFRHPGARIGWRVDRRRLARTLPARAWRKLIGRVRPYAKPVN